MDRLSSSKGSMIEQVNLGQIPTSSFDRQNHNFLSGKLGKLIITRLDEVYPADRITGDVTAVANFEPLASPIMGSMVMKQEAFYIPDDILWKNAHKFYTGKKNFNTPRPSVSPQDIYNSYKSLFDITIDTELFLQSWLDNAVIGGGNDSLAFIAALYPTINTAYNTVKTYSTQHGVYDVLFMPFETILKKYFGHISDLPDYNSLIGSAASDYATDSTAAKLNVYTQLIADFFTDVYEFLFGVSSLADYIGWPVFDNWFEYFHSDFDADLRFADSLESVTTPLGADMFSAIPLDFLPWRAAYVCWYWNYRDELLETDALDPESDDFLGDNVTIDQMILCTILRVRCWYKDFVTTALTNTGDGNLLVPVDVSNYNGTSPDVSYYDYDGNLIQTTDKDAAISAGAAVCGISIGGVDYRVPMNYLQGAQVGDYGSISNGNTDFALSLDLFDRIKRLRSFVMKKLILGYEYDDVLWSSFRVRLSNVRMRIPEILGRSRDAVDMMTLVNNTTTTEQIAGDKTASAWANGSMRDINYFAEEHGYYLQFLTILPLQTYLGGMQRLWLKRETFDKMWPEFATMGMDAVYNCELSAPRGKLAIAGLDDDAALAVFGYQGRYYDLKSKLDESHGRMRTDLRFMTFSREFNMDNKPALNYIFVHCWPRTDMFVSDDSNIDVIRTIDVHSALDWQRQLPVPSEYIN